MRLDYIDVNDNMRCCGLIEINGIGENYPENVVEDLFTASYDGKLHYDDPPSCAHIIFSQATRRASQKSYGGRLAEYVIANGLGRVIASPANYNPNSTNRVTCFVWTPDLKGIQRWIRERNKEKKNA